VLVMGLGVIGLWWGLSTGLIDLRRRATDAWSRHVASFNRP
jgi:hypothetical protein